MTLNDFTPVIIALSPFIGLIVILAICAFILKKHNHDKAK